MSDRASLRVLLATSWGEACGIAEHSALLIEAVQRVDPRIEIITMAEALNPAWVTHELAHPTSALDLIHLNHHDALHSRWTPGHVRALTEKGIPVLVTYHDTRATLAECPKLAQLAQVASSVIVHEPVDGLHAIYWRQGVPPAAQDPMHYDEEFSFKSYPQQPVLGSIGFPFPWKNYDRLAQLTRELGWALVLLAPNATDEDEGRWRAANPSLLCIRTFLPADQALNYLAGCDATAFMYECANTGTSGAIRMGIAARKPVIALATCRQFRDLYEEKEGALWGLGRTAINWVEDWEGLGEVLTHFIHPARYDPGVVALAARDGWGRLGREYARLYRVLASGGGA